MKTLFNTTLGFLRLVSLVPVVILLVTWSVARGRFGSARIIVFEHHLPAWSRWFRGE